MRFEQNRSKEDRDGSLRVADRVRGVRRRKLGPALLGIPLYLQKRLFCRGWLKSFDAEESRRATGHVADAQDEQQDGCRLGDRSGSQRSGRARLPPSDEKGEAEGEEHDQSDVWSHQIGDEYPEEGEGDSAGSSGEEPRSAEGSKAEREQHHGFLADA